MVWHLFELVLMTGAIGPAIFVAAYLLWRGGVSDPFGLTVAAMVIGTVAGHLLNRGMGKLIDRSKRRA